VWRNGTWRAHLWRSGTWQGSATSAPPGGGGMGWIDAPARKHTRAQPVRKRRRRADDILIYAKPWL